jgi:ABC-type phosphate transport system auxiliary subunit
LKVKNGDGEARKIQEKRLAELEKQMEEYLEQEDEQYDLLEQKTYTPEVFARRNGKLREKIDACQNEIRKVKSSMPKNINYAEHVISLEKAIAAWKNPDMTAGEKNKILKAIISKVEYTGPPTGSEHAKRGVTPFTLEVFLRL